MSSPDKPLASGWRDLAYVPRWAILRRNRHQFLAEHSYFVAVYADQIARLIGWSGSYENLFRYALYHDVEETVTGDVPGPTKRAAWNYSSARSQIEPVMRRKFGEDVAACLYKDSDEFDEIRAIVSFADSVEEVAYLSEERMSGNSIWVASVFEEAILRMKKKWWLLPTDSSTLMEKEKFVNSIVMIQNEQPELLRDGVFG